MLKDFNPEELSDECSECMASFPERYKIIYTRKKEWVAGSDTVSNIETNEHHGRHT